MSDRYIGGLIKGDGTELTTSRFGTNSGMFTLGQQLNAFQSGNWPSDYDVIAQFTGTGSWECPSGVDEIAEYVIIGGGGGGGSDMGGGGGAGGFRIGTNMPVVAGKTYPIEVGSGGAGGSGGPAGPAGIAGVNSGFKTEANVRYYVSVGNPGAGNKYYVKTEQSDDAASNLTPELKLYEGSTYVFDQSHPTNAPNHPLRFASDGAPSFTPYTTGVTTNQPSVGVGTPASAVQIQVASSAPDLFYYCTVHGAMGNEIETLGNISMISRGGGGGASNSHDAPNQNGGSGGGGGGKAQPTVDAGGTAESITVNTTANESTPGVVQTNKAGFDGGDSSGVNYAAGGGGGAGQAGFNGTPSPQDVGGNGGNGQTITIRGSSEFVAGGGGGGASTVKGLAGSGGAGNGGQAPLGDVVAAGIAGDIRTGSGGGGGGGNGGVSGGGSGGSGGSGIVLIKYKNKNSNRVFKFTGSGLWKNDFDANEIEYLVVAGGGGGGRNGAGGGAGGFTAGTGLKVAKGGIIPITVGGGGEGGFGSGTQVGGSNGSNSSLSSITSIAGGGGSGNNGPAPNNVRARSGGSGGGGGQGFTEKGLAITGDQPSDHKGNHGGIGTASGLYGAGGGGGAGQAGADGSTSEGGGFGGNGLSSIITGISTFYAGGGGGGSNDGGGSSADYVGGLGGGGNGKNSVVGEDGQTSTGGGAGGGGYDLSPGPLGQSGGKGGSGIVVIKITG